MGQTHNRKRTRSRPRTRNPNFVRDYSTTQPWSFRPDQVYCSPPAHSYIPSVTLKRSSRSSSIYSTTSSSSWSERAIPPPAPLATEPTGPRPTPSGPKAYSVSIPGDGSSNKRGFQPDASDVAVSAAKRARIFGPDNGDEEGELCGPMLKVVFDLFDGYDYEDGA
ncbi:Rho-GTPase-activating protein 8 [Sphaceloma murrayae]|uniref:Rho-GTPase-activating protein 8 n=1 Tax=Sphaceloma murrayae TaxID=2082308 RepID=A0A2K1QQU0_9PEZI|nr:Rho-GTPase-activating protein 8 [Sphaceloma murrayae]